MLPSLTEAMAVDPLAGKEVLLALKRLVGMTPITIGCSKKTAIWLFLEKIKKIFLQNDSLWGFLCEIARIETP
jgi:hypothetical protein